MTLWELGSRYALSLKTGGTGIYHIQSAQPYIHWSIIFNFHNGLTLLGSLRSGYAPNNHSFLFVFIFRNIWDFKLVSPDEMRIPNIYMQSLSVILNVRSKIDNKKTRASANEWLQPWMLGYWHIAPYIQILASMNLLLNRIQNTLDTEQHVWRSNGFLQRIYISYEQFFWPEWTQSQKDKYMKKKRIFCNPAPIPKEPTTIHDHDNQLQQTY